MLTGSSSTVNDETAGVDSENSSSSTQNRPSGQRKRILGSSVLTAGSSVPTLSLNNSSLNPKPKPNSCFIFSDETAHEDNTLVSPWSDIGTKQSRKKENTREVTKAGNGVPLLDQKSRRVVSAPIRSSFVPFVDGNFDNADIEGLPRHAGRLSDLMPTISTISTLSTLRDSGEESSNSRLRVKSTHQLTESEALKKDPLKNYHNP